MVNGVWTLHPNPGDPALVVGYGRLALASIDAAVEQLAGAV